MARWVLTARMHSARSIPSRLRATLEAVRFVRATLRTQTVSCGTNLCGERSGSRPWPAHSCGSSERWGRWRLDEAAPCLPVHRRG
eukprot:204448-Rhodomonas_salina.3